ncbi:hypothetical protein GBA63_22610 (plasmid) [Rubrobacter tropicus]|uniref:Uncharacterized protein n=1 Tax=Rubrobacter tropicus TaxID=2653851 RepID=A0A6G8QGC1_9ACTN|nr:hypothetical protein [Rubrobacter tropicus]QIN85493.1 hypothetical protein GBA63_22610 [Rubrobacter tropicus]
MPPADEPYHSPPADPRGYRPERRERADSYWTFLILGLATPFLLAVFLYPLAWYPVWYVVLPVVGLVASLLRWAQPAAPPPGGPMPWDLGPILSSQVALTWAVAILVAWFVLSRITGAGPAGRRIAQPEEDSAADCAWRSWRRSCWRSSGPTACSRPDPSRSLRLPGVLQ